MIYKKSVVLTSVNGGKEKGVVSLEYDGGEMVGNVRLYNFDKEPDGILSLGILANNSVLKAGLTSSGAGVYSFKLSGAKELGTFSCALVNFVKGSVKPLLFGATSGEKTSEERLINSLSIFDNDATVENVESVLNENQVYLEDDFEELSDTKTCQAKCSDCKYRDAFFKLEDTISPIQEEEESSFFDGVKEQIEQLFDKYPEEEILKEIIPESKWAKIDFEDKGEYYVVGILYENNEPSYVCYGVPGIYTEEAPAELKGFAQWLPIDVGKEKGFGYWITYQDAKTGENIKLDFETI